MIDSPDFSFCRCRSSPRRLRDQRRSARHAGWCALRRSTSGTTWAIGPRGCPCCSRRCARLDADVIALQEVLEDAAKGLPNQADTIARALGNYSVHFVSTDPEGAPRRYGNAILTRLPVLAVESRKLEPLDDYRTAIRVRVRAHGRPIDVVNTHLAWQEDAGPVRARQVSDLFSWLPAPGVPLIVMGDFNAPLTDAGLGAIDRPALRQRLAARFGATTLNPAKKHPNRVIDHIFVERQWFDVGAALVIGNEAVNGEYPSDHFGVAATLGLR